MGGHSFVPVEPNATSRNDLVERGFIRQPLRVDVEVARTLEALSHAAWSIPRDKYYDYRYAVSTYDGPGQGSMLRDQRPEISRSGKSAAQDPHRDARRHGSGALLRVEGRPLARSLLVR